MAKDNSFIKLRRSTTNRIIAGVAGGLGEYFNIDPTILRIAFILLTVFGGSGILIYLVLWLIMPNDQSQDSDSNEHIKKNVTEISERARSFAQDIRLNPTREDSRFWWGLTIIIFGFLVLFHNFGLFEIFNIGKLWPIILVVLGVMILTRNKR